MLCIFDLDGFEQYNDTFGHGAGDALLMRLGQRLTMTLRGIGTAEIVETFCRLISDADSAPRAAPA